jgi:hypothetical protein
MRKILILFLLVMLPFQLSWAGAGVYCQHETGQAAQHFGHHEHKHTVHGDQGKIESDKANQGADNDCSFHLNGFNCFLSSQDTRTLSPAVVFNDIPPPQYVSYIPDGPERPDRLLAA